MPLPPVEGACVAPAEGASGGAEADAWEEESEAEAPLPPPPEALRPKGRFTGRQRPL